MIGIKRPVCSFLLLHVQVGWDFLPFLARCDLAHEVFDSVHVAEIFSPPRVTAAASRYPRFGIAPGLALDLTTTDSEGQPWDFSDPAQRAKAEKLIEEENPTLLIGTPMCTAFSILQA